MIITHRNAAPIPEESIAYTPLTLAGEHKPYLGKLAKPGPLYRTLVKEYRALFGVGESDYAAEMLEWACGREGSFEVTLLFIDEAAISRGGITWFCLKAIGKDGNGDYYYLTLDQLVLCG